MKNTLLLASALLLAAPSLFALETANRGPASRGGGPAAPLASIPGIQGIDLRAAGAAPIAAPDTSLPAPFAAEAAASHAQDGAALGIVGEPRGARRERDAAAEQIGGVSKGLGELQLGLGDVSAAGDDSARRFGEQAQDLLQGRASASARGEVAAPAASGSAARFLSRAAGSRSASRALQVGAVALTTLATSATPLLAHTPSAVQSVLAPLSMLGIVSGLVLALMIGYAKRDGVLEWVKLASAYVVSYGFAGALIGAAAWAGGAALSSFTSAGLWVGVALSAVVAIGRWLSDKNDEPYTALGKSLSFIGGFSAVGLIVGLLYLMGGAALAAPTAIGVIAGAAMSFVIGAVARQDEYEWLAKAGVYVAEFAAAGFVIGLLALLSSSIASATAAGIIGAALASLWTAAVSAKGAKPQDAYEWAIKTAIYMFFGAVVAGALGALGVFGSALVAWPMAIGATAGILGIIVADKALFFSGNPTESVDQWLPRAAAYAAVGAVFGLIVGLTALASLPVAWSAAIGIGLGLIPAIVAGVSRWLDDKPETSDEWLARLASYAGTSGALGLLMGVLAAHPGAWLAWPTTTALLAGAFIAGIGTRVRLLGHAVKDGYAWLGNVVMLGGFSALVAFGVTALARVAGYI